MSNGMSSDDEINSAGLSEDYLRTLDLATRASRITPTEPRIQNDDVTFFIRHCLCDPVFFAEVREVLHPIYFQPQETPIQCVWQAMCARHPSAFTVEGLVSSIHEYLRGDPNVLLSPQTMQALTGPQNVLVEWLATPRA